ncbi:MAG: hypothetical protein ACRC5R_00025 [Mycoplasmatales bacterium]
MKSKYLNLYILFFIIIFIFIASYFVNVGTYEYDEKFNPKIGTYGPVEIEPLKIQDVLTSPINGMIGIDNKADHSISYKNSGNMVGSISLMILVLSIGAYMQVMEKTKVLTIFISNNINVIGRNFNKGILLVMLFFTIGATTHGMYETTIGFAPLIILMYDKLKIKRIEVLFLMLLPLATGHIGGTINPFATGIASNLLGISIMDGIISRIILLVILFVTSLMIVLIRTKKYDVASIKMVKKMPFNKLILCFFLVPFILMIYTFIPGSPLRLDFITVSIVFIVSGIIIGFIGKLSFDDIIDQLFKGMNNFFIVAFSIGFARGVYVLLYNTYLSDTLINKAIEIFAEKDMIIVIIILMVIFFILTLLIPSTSALALITMPIIGTAIMMMGINPELVVTIYQSMVGVLKIIAPTSPLVIALLTMTGVRYNEWFKETYKYVLFYSGIIFFVLVAFYGG